MQRLRLIKQFFKYLLLMLVLTAGIVFCCGFSHTVSEDEKYDVKLLSSFTTYFDSGNEARSHNIRLAASLINRSVVKNGETFSFNETVGQRTEKRGFKTAAIIKDGEFVSGVGGGVCQVSTTLYNAALLSGCKITEYHPHSLPVSYVAPSRDAMVSGTFFDLKFENVTGGTLYVTSSTGRNFVKFNIYGRDCGARYMLSSSVTGAIAAPEEFTSDLSLVRQGKDGIISEGYLTVTFGGKKRSVLLRRDKYMPQKKVTFKEESEAEPDDIPQENNLPQ